MARTFLSLSIIDIEAKIVLVFMGSLPYKLVSKQVYERKPNLINPEYVLC